MDEYLGRTKPPAIAVNSVVPVLQKVRINSMYVIKFLTHLMKKTSVPRGRLDPALQHASHLRKPQLAFKKVVDNNDTPWYPNILHKYNAQVPLGYAAYHDSAGILDGTSATVYVPKPIFICYDCKDNNRD